MSPDRIARGEDQDLSDKDHATNLRVDVAVLKVQITGIDKKLDNLASSLTNAYATKDEVKGVREDVATLKGNQGWIIKLIVGAVVVAVLGLVIVKGGVPRQ